MKVMHIAPTAIMGEIDAKFNKGNNMLLTHLVLNDESYREEARKLGGVKLLDNSFFELGYCMKPDEILEAARLCGATTVICADGTLDGAELYKNAGYDIMAIPKTPTQFVEFMKLSYVDLVGISVNNIAKKGSPTARYDLLKQHYEREMGRKIHLLGASDSIFEVGLLREFSHAIVSMDTSAAVWNAYMNNMLSLQVKKDRTPVDFSADIKVTKLMENNIAFLNELANGGLI